MYLDALYLLELATQHVSRSDDRLWCSRRELERHGTYPDGSGAGGRNAILRPVSAGDGILRHLHGAIRTASTALGVHLFQGQASRR